MKTCPKCGRANDVTRKFCTRCGASLLKQEGKSAPEPAKTAEPRPIQEEPAAPDQDYVEEPSEVAFHPEESEQMEAEEENALEEADYSADEEFEEETQAPPESEIMDHERGRAVVKDILQKVRDAEARSKVEHEASEPAATGEEEEEEEAVEAFEEEEVEEIEEPPTVEEASIEEEIEAPYPEPAPPPSQEPVLRDYAPTVPRPAVAEAVDEIARDEKIRTIDSDIKTHNIELGQLNSEFDKLQGRLNDEVDRYLTVAETKRTRFESLDRDLKLAKKEYDQANKEYKSADDRRKKELSNAEKRIKDVEKRIRKAEDAKKKRIDDLEKERRKREEEAMKG